MADTGTASCAMHSVLHHQCCYVAKSEAERNSYRKLAVDIVGQTVPSRSMKECWVLQRKLLPHGQAIHNSMKPEIEAETDLHVTSAHKKLAGMFAT
jgi:hypothetical protein